MHKIDWLMDWAARIRKSPLGTALVPAVIGIAVVAAIGIAVFGSSALLFSFLLIGLALVGIYILSVQLLIGSCVVAVVLKYEFGLIKATVDVFAPHKADKLFELIDRTATHEIAAAVFFFAFLLTFLTSCIKLKLFVVNNTTKVEVKPDNKEKDKKKDEYPHGV
jgi:uncharacterized membrane protein (Fun14 family)